ncbi:unnamed protein product [Brassica rapa subsp. trilocularis]
MVAPFAPELNSLCDFFFLNGYALFRLRVTRPINDIIEVD